MTEAPNPEGERAARIARLQEIIEPLLRDKRYTGLQVVRILRGWGERAREEDIRYAVNRTAFDVSHDPDQGLREKATRADEEREIRLGIERILDAIVAENIGTEYTDTAIFQIAQARGVNAQLADVQAAILRYRQKVDAEQSVAVMPVDLESFINHITTGRELTTDAIVSMIRQVGYTQDDATIMAAIARVLESQSAAPSITGSEKPSGTAPVTTRQKREKARSSEPPIHRELKEHRRPVRHEVDFSYLDEPIAAILRKHGSDITPPKIAALLAEQGIDVGQRRIIESLSRIRSQRKEKEEPTEKQVFPAPAEPTGEEAAMLYLEKNYSDARIAELTGMSTDEIRQLKLRYVRERRKKSP